MPDTVPAVITAVTLTLGSVGAHALPILVDVKENADEKSLDNMVLAFGGGVDGLMLPPTLVHATAKATASS